jgi:hypothetical protein
MTVSQWSEVDSARARQIWAEYQKHHDLSAQRGQTVGIDPISGRLWFGDSAIDIVRQMNAEGIHAPLYFLRVGFDYYIRKRATTDCRLTIA